MESEIFEARIHDTADICERTSRPKFLGFLSREEAVLAGKIIEKRNVRHRFFGGYEDAERLVLGCFPEWDEEQNFPIVAVTFAFRKEDKLSHRDFLGSLMGLGLTRESVGDILVEEGRAVAFLLEDISEFVFSQIEKVGRTGVAVTKGFVLPLPQKSEVSESNCTVASERLDCVVAALCNLSRNTAAEKIAEGLVSVNSVITEKTTKTVTSGDAVTVRGKGKFIIDSIDGKTRKNRIVLKYKKYV